METRVSCSYQEITVFILYKILIVVPLSPSHKLSFHPANHTPDVTSGKADPEVIYCAKVMLRNSFSTVVLMALIASFRLPMSIATVPAFIKKTKKYTPLLFFKVPPGRIPECKNYCSEFLVVC